MRKFLALVALAVALLSIVPHALADEKDEGRVTDEHPVQFMPE
jgi:hypothetical protein